MKITEVDLNGPNLIAKLATMAAHNTAVNASIEELVAAADLVFAIWPEPEHPEGVAMLPIKVAKLLKTKRFIEAATSAIACADLCEALELVRRFGEPIAVRH
jgi:3-hydroxyisobutyrate dehydrogenase-like beta-hydroxyacid dehydrogenase